MLDTSSQIEKMKQQGIRFELMSEDQASDFLSFNTYYFKIKSYAKNYEKDKDGKYRKLDFEYLREISVLDTHLRSTFLDLCLSIEHQLKVLLMRRITEDPKEDGYTIITDLFIKYPWIKKEISKRHRSASSDLKIHYNDLMPIWVFLELCSYDWFIKLFEIYFEKADPKLLAKVSYLIYSSKFIRNACAHNNCLLNSMRDTYTDGGNPFTPSKKLKSEVARITDLSKKSIETNLSNHVVHDIVATLLLFKRICTSNKMYENVMKDMDDLFSKRFLRHKDYFLDNSLLIGRYQFLMKIFDTVRCVE